MGAADGSSTNCLNNVRPPVTTFTPSLWNDIFTSFSLDEQVQENYMKEIEALKAEAKKLLMVEGSMRMEKLVLIDTLERLGLAYHFEQEIEEQLQQIVQLFPTIISEDDNCKDYNLCTIALQFRLMRQHHYPISCGVFDKFKNKGNNFEETLGIDVKGLLSLYEATQVRFHGEEILEEALDFTTYHLNHMLPHLESPIRDQVNRALERYSVQRSVPIVEARNFISIYERDGEKNEVLLKMAKLHFNFLQNLYKKEMCDLMRWWKELDIISKFPYTRDRIVESYLWGLTFHFESQYSYLRIQMAKTVQMFGVLDDAYDNYATIEEAEIFTEILERWDINEIDKLPEWMKIVYQFVLGIYEDYEHEAARQGKSFSVPYAKESVKQVARAYLQELKWLMGRQMPSFEEYFSNMLFNGCIYPMIISTVPGLNSVDKETIEWFVNGNNKMVLTAPMIGRYLNDIGSCKREEKNGEMLTVMDCYMKQYGVSRKETVQKFSEFVEDGWKVINIEWVAETWIPKDFFEMVINYARSTELFYKNSEDNWSNPKQFLAPIIASLLLHPIYI